MTKFFKLFDQTVAGPRAGFCQQVQWISWMGGLIRTGMVSLDLDSGVALLADRLPKVASSLSA